MNGERKDVSHNGNVTSTVDLLWDSVGSVELAVVDALWHMRCWKHARPWHTGGQPMTRHHCARTGRVPKAHVPQRVDDGELDAAHTVPQQVDGAWSRCRCG